MRRYWYLAIAGAIASVLAVMPLTAFAAAAGVLTVGGVGGPAVNVGDTLIGTLNGSATFVNVANANQNVTCTTSGITAADVPNPVPQGTAQETVSSQTFGNCKANNITFVTGINSVTTNASATCPWHASIDDHTNPATVTISPNSGSGCSGIIHATVNVQTLFGPITCVYQANGGTVAGTAALGSNAGIVISNARFNKTSGPGTCFTAANSSATYPFVDQNQGNGSVFVN